MHLEFLLEDDIFKNSARRTLPLLGVIAILIALIVVPIYNTQSANAAFDGGVGTPASPYLIATCDQLFEIDDVSGNLTASYYITQNLDCQNTDIGVIGRDAVFTGSLDGRNHTISNIFISDSDAKGGLFSEANGASFKNFTLEDVSIACGTDCGSLVGYAINTSIINVAVTGTVNGQSNVGGIVGRGVLLGFDHVASHVGVSGSQGQKVGGILGDANLATISDSYSDGSVFAFDIGGGFYGAAINSRIVRSYSAASVSSGNGLVGGFAGSFSGTGNVNTGAQVVDSFVVGSISSSAPKGFFGISDDDDNVTNSYWDIDSTGAPFCGTGDTACFPITAEPGRWYNTSEIAPLDEWDFDKVWQISGGVNGGALPVLQTGLLSPQAPLNLVASVGHPDSFSSVALSWDQPESNGLDTDDYVVYYREHGSGPYTSESHPDTQNGFSLVQTGLLPQTEYDFYVRASNEAGESIASNIITFTTSALNNYAIANCDDLQGMQNDLDGIYTVVNLVNCQQFNLPDGFTPIGSTQNPFTGTLDGNEQGIVAVSAGEVGGTNQGLFAETDGATIKDLTVSQFHISGKFNIGGLIGTAHDTSIDNVYSFSQNIDVEDDDSIYAGGIVGLLADGSSLTNSTSEQATVRGNSSMGGAVGSCDTSTIDGLEIIDSFVSAYATKDSAAIGGAIGSSLLCTVTNSFALTTTTIGYRSVGGFIGDDNLSSFDNVHTSGSVQGIDATFQTSFNKNESIGGLAGRTASTTFIDSFSFNSVKGLEASTESLGGFVGTLTNSSVDRAYSSGNVIGNETNGVANKVGGFVGSNTNGHIYDAFASGSISGDGAVGGFAGQITNGDVQRAYSSGSLSGSPIESGGFVGSLNSGALVNIFTTSFVDQSSSSMIGAIAGMFHFQGATTFTNAYFDITRTGVSNCSGNDSDQACTGVNATSTQEDYFENNRSNPPLNNWNFDNIWYYNNVGLPTLFAGDHQGAEPTTTTTEPETSTTDAPVTTRRNTVVDAPLTTAEETTTTIDPKKEKIAQAFAGTFDEKTTKTVVVDDKDIIDVPYNGKNGPATTRVTIEKVEGNKVTISYSYDGADFTVTLMKGATIELDFDGDGKSDVSATVNSTENGKAKITFKKLTQVQNESDDVASSYTWLVLIFGVLIGATIAWFVVNKNKK